MKLTESETVALCKALVAQAGLLERLADLYKGEAQRELDKQARELRALVTKIQG